MKYSIFEKTFRSSIVISLDESPPPDSYTISQCTAAVSLTLQMLHSRKDLVGHFFSLPVFGEEECRTMMALHDKGEPLSAAVTGLVKPQGAASLSDIQYSQLADVANAFEVFDGEVTGADMRGLFCDLNVRLRIRDVRQKAGMFIKAVVDSNRLYSNYQALMESRRLVVNRDGDKPLTSLQLSQMSNRSKISDKYINMQNAVETVLRTPRRDMD